MIVIGSRGHSEVTEYFLGSTSNYVLHKSLMPVMIVR
jgi:nucleotide-binding universal stress UspA family protein